MVKIEKNKSIPKCSCKNIETHKSHKLICEKINDLIRDSNEFYILLHPIQFINMLFKSQNNFKIIFEDLDIKNPKNSNMFEFFSKFLLKD